MTDTEYTPSLMDAQSYYVAGRAQINRQITGVQAQDITPFSAEFDRMIEAVRQEEREKTLREAAESYVHVHAVSRVHSYVYRWLMGRADRIREQGREQDRG